MSTLKRIAFGLMTAAIMACATTRAQNADLEERKKLEGTWAGYVVNVGVKGQSGKGVMTTVSEFIIKGGRITAKDGQGRGLGQGNSFKLDLNKEPKYLDAVGSTSQSRGTYLGIYRLNGDRLEWCVANPGKPRPTQFNTQQFVQFHLILQRKQ